MGPQLEAEAIDGITKAHTAIAAAESDTSFFIGPLVVVTMRRH
jgi:hypothetical protein